jgi:membrane protein HdeD
MTEISVQRTRTGWDIALGALLVIAGFIILGNTVFATLVSVLFIGWMTLVSGIFALVSAFLNAKGKGFWVSLITAGLLIVLGIMILRHPVGTAFALTLIAGFVFLISGVMRIAASRDFPEGRWMLIISGAISVALGLVVLFSPVQSTFTLLGILLGVQVVIDGLMMMLNGRVRISWNPLTAPGAPAAPATAAAGPAAPTAPIPTTPPANPAP